MPDFSFFKVKEFNLFKITIGGNNKNEIGNASKDGSFFNDSSKIENKTKKLKIKAKLLDDKNKKMKRLD